MKFAPIESTDGIIAIQLSKILLEANYLNQSIINPQIGLNFQSDLTFNIEWGLGSSSSLISNIAYLFDIDPYQLFQLVHDGSGYDIACARSYKPLVYSISDLKPIIEQSFFHPEFKRNIYFIYTGKKAITSEGIKLFKKDMNFNNTDIQAISDLTDKMVRTKQLNEFERIIVDHEIIMSKILKTRRVKELYFNDFDGEIKSLGAWGGDFVMVTWKGKRNKLEEYFKEKGLETVFRFDEMVV